MGFIHAKLYITPKRAYAGSANMTYSAHSRNIELLIEVDRDDAVRFFNEAWSKASPLITG